MRLKNPGTLPRRLFDYDKTQEWFRLFDRFAASDDEYAEVIDHGYNDPWTAQEYGTRALAGREVISGYMSQFRLDVLQGRLFIIRR
jgi:hypothetical protein